MFLTFLIFTYLQASSVQSNTSSLSPYTIFPVADAATTLGSFVTLGLMEGVVKRSLPGGLHCQTDPTASFCDSSSLSRFDRWTLNNPHPQVWSKVSDGLAIPLYILPFAATALDNTLNNAPALGKDFLYDSVVLAETVGVATLATHTLKYAVRRARPSMYASHHHAATAEQSMSFPSGHTASVAAITTAYAYTFQLRHPNSPWRYAVWGAAGLGTGLVGYARMAANAHFLSDVLAGAAIGASFGLLIPYLHQHSIQLTAHITQQNQLVMLQKSF